MENAGNNTWRWSPFDGLEAIKLVGCKLVNTVTEVKRKIQNAVMLIISRFKATSGVLLDWWMYDKVARRLWRCTLQYIHRTWPSGGRHQSVPWRRNVAPRFVPHRQKLDAHCWHSFEQWRVTDWNKANTTHCIVQIRTTAAGMRKTTWLYKTNKPVKIKCFCNSRSLR